MQSRHPNRWIPNGGGDSRTNSALWRILLCLYGLLIAYGSLIPFHFDLNAPIRFSSFHGIDSADLLINVLIYIPLGVLLNGARLVPPTNLGLCAAVGVIFSLSFSLECAQMAIVERVASLTDVMLNSLGGMAGILGTTPLVRGSRVFLRRCARCHNERPLRSVVVIVVLSVLLLECAPFELITCTHELQESLRRSSLFNGFGALSSPYRSGWSAAADGVVFALLALLMQCAGGRRSVVSSMIVSCSRAILIVVLIEILQLFIRFHQFDLPVLMNRSCWVLVASVGGGLLTWPSKLNTRASSSRSPVPTFALTVAGVIVAAKIITAQANICPDESTARCWPPLVVFWQMPPIVGLSVAAVLCLAYGILAMLVESLNRRRGVFFSSLATLLIVYDLAIVGELWHAQQRGVDLSLPLLALVMASCIGLWKSQPALFVCSANSIEPEK